VVPDATGATLHLRAINEDDFEPVLRATQEWWGGRNLSHLVHPFMFRHFRDLSRVIETDDGQLAAFAVAFASPSETREVYLHLMAVSPLFRRRGLGRRLCRELAREGRRRGRSVISCVTSPENEVAQALYRTLGFEVIKRAERVEFRLNIGDGDSHLT